VLDRVGVAAEQAAGQRDGQLVDAVARLVDRRDALDGQQRPEDLLAQDGRARVDVGDDDRRAVPPAAGALLGQAMGDHGPRGRRLLGVAGHALLRGALDDRPDLGAERVGRADLQDVDGARQALEQLVGDRLVDQDAGGCRALLARVVEGRADDGGDRVVEVGVAVDDHAVLAAHLDDGALELLLAGDDVARGADDLQADRPRAGERDRRHAWVAHQRGAGLAVALQQPDRLGRDAGVAQRLDEHEAAQRRLLGGLEDHRVAGRQRRGDHAGRDRDREVPRRDDRGHAARRVVQAVALAGDLEQRPAAAQCDRAPRVELQEVDGLADVGVGLGPRLARLAHAERRERGPALAHPRGGAREHRGALAGGQRGPVAVAVLGGADRRGDLQRCGDRRGGDDALGVGRVGGDEPVAVAALGPDPDRRRERQALVDPGQALEQLVPMGGPAQLEHGLVVERRKLGHGAASSSSSGFPAAWSARNDSLLVFSSRRRTR
jgi:hypothetical protein